MKSSRSTTFVAIRYFCLFSGAGAKTKKSKKKKAKQEGGEPQPQSGRVTLPIPDPSHPPHPNPSDDVTSSGVSPSMCMMMERRLLPWAAIMTDFPESSRGWREKRKKDQEGRKEERKKGRKGWDG